MLGIGRIDNEGALTVNIFGGRDLGIGRIRETELLGESLVLGEGGLVELLGEVHHGRVGLKVRVAAHVGGGDEVFAVQPLAIEGLKALGKAADAGGEDEDGGEEQDFQDQKETGPEFAAAEFGPGQGEGVAES